MQAAIAFAFALIVTLGIIVAILADQIHSLCVNVGMLSDTKASTKDIEALGTRIDNEIRERKEANEVVDTNSAIYGYIDGIRRRVESLEEQLTLPSPPRDSLICIAGPPKRAKKKAVK